MTTTKEILKFEPFSSSIDAGFWPVMSKKKLEEFQLSEEPVPIHGSYRCNNKEGVPSILQLDYTCFQSMPRPRSTEYPVAGDLIILNTKERFKDIDKKQLLREHAEHVWKKLFDASTLSDGQVLNRFLLLTFADLKKYHYYYWFAFPAFADVLPIVKTSPTSSITTKFSQEQLNELTTQIDTLRSHGKSLQYFVIYGNDSKLTVYTLDNESIKSLSLSDVTFVFSDPSTSENPGWPLRNYLSLISAQFIKNSETSVSVAGWRERVINGVREVSHSITLSVQLSSLNRDMGRKKLENLYNED